MKELIQIFMAVLGTLGFCMIFRVDRRHILAPTIGGGICWAFYLLLRSFGLTVFPATLLSAGLVGVYGEIMAHLRKVPTTVYFIPACVPLIPGSNLYYATVSLLSRNMEGFRQNGILLIEYSFGIAIGLGLVLELEHLRSRVFEKNGK